MKCPAQWAPPEGSVEMKGDESRAGYKQRMLKKRLEQAEAEVELLRRSVASYRTYQEHELDEVRLWCPLRSAFN